MRIKYVICSLDYFFDNNIKIFKSQKYLTIELVLVPCTMFPNGFQS
jgi:hypothetical protein